ncbi:MAG: MBL fold metallo-hydrolase [Granulosicoccus sp.]
MKGHGYSRRRFLQTTAALGGAALCPLRLAAADSPGGISSMPLGDGQFFSLSDGQLQLPVSMSLPDSLSEQQQQSIKDRNNLSDEFYTPDCNVVLWKTAEKIILFDTGAGSQFPVGGGELASQLETIGIDPYDVTDVVFTHAHPDHLWGVLDDFDDLAFPEAQFHMSQREWDYWLNPNTLSRTPENRQSFVVGAQNRLPLLADQIALFNGGDEILPGIEVVDSFGHTPGHSSLMIHDGNRSLFVVGDAIANAVVSFEYPSLLSGSDQDQNMGSSTRLALLDRLAHDKSLIVGYHLPAPGIGYVERSDNAFRFAPV